MNTEDIRRLVLKHLPDVAPKPGQVEEADTLTREEEQAAVQNKQLEERRKTIEEVRSIQSDLDDMTRKANAAIRLINLKIM